MTPRNSVGFSLHRLRIGSGAGWAASSLAALLMSGCADTGRQPLPSSGYSSTASHRQQRPTADRYAPVGSASPEQLAEPADTAIAPITPSAGQPPLLPTAGRMQLTERERWRDEDYLRDENRRPRAAVNPWTDALQDPRSTFGMDVDTAAFAIARDYLRRNELPPPESVRTEEFVNYFDYRDAAQPHQTFTVNAEMAPTPFAPKSYLLRIGLRAKPVSAERRKPAKLTFLIDVSGSMEPANRLPLVREALHDLVDRLQPDDQIALVVFSNSAEVFMNPTPVTEKRSIHNVIDRLVIGGATSVEDGLRTAYRLAATNFDPQCTNRVILCSDGEANVGDASPEGILAEIERCRARGIYLSTVGFGLKDYNDRMLETLADKGDGVYDHIDRIDEADRVFGDKLTSLLEVVAKDAKIQVEFNPDRVAEYRLLGYENRAIADRDFRNDRVDAGEVGAGHAVTALYEITLLDRPRTTGDNGQDDTARRAAIDAAVDALVDSAPATAPNRPTVIPPPAAGPAIPPPAADSAGTAADPHRRADNDTALPALSHLARIRLRYKLPDNRRGETLAAGQEAVVESTFTLTDQAIERTLSRASADFRLSMAAAQFSELLRGSPYASRQDIDSVLALLRSVEQDRPNDDQVLDLYDMALNYKQLLGEGRLSRR